MEISYWQSRWRNNKTGWHMNTVYPLLPKLWPQLSLPEGARILVPLCGMSLDMNWLIRQGYYVIGVDAVKKGLTKWMDSYDHAYTTESKFEFEIYRSDNIELWCGDFLKLPQKEIAPINAVYDKAAIVALPEDKRAQYAQKILTLSDKNTHIMLQTFEYKQDEMNGPPFSLPEEEVKSFYGDHFKINLLHEQSKMKELSKFQRRGLSTYLLEKVYHLIPLDVK